MLHIYLCISLVAANVIYQCFREEPDWKRAAERSWFQAIAVLMCWLLSDLK